MTADTPENRGTETETETMGDVDHTHPYTGQPFGSCCVFERGPTVAADGGSPGGTDETTIEDVGHRHPHGSEATARLFERGTEGRDGSV